MLIISNYTSCIILLASLCFAFAQPKRESDEWYKEKWPPQPYAFGYEIRDISGNEQYRKETSDGSKVTGSYGYMGSDGIFRHVDYIADELGFRAKIRTSEQGMVNESPADVRIETNPVLPSYSPPPPIRNANLGTFDGRVQFDNLNSLKEDRSNNNREENIYGTNPQDRIGTFGDNQPDISATQVPRVNPRRNNRNLISQLYGITPRSDQIDGFNNNYIDKRNLSSNPNNFEGVRIQSNGIFVANRDDKIRRPINFQTPEKRIDSDKESILNKNSGFSTNQGLTKNAFGFIEATKGGGRAVKMAKTYPVLRRPSPKFDDEVRHGEKQQKDFRYPQMKLAFLKAPPESQDYPTEDVMTGDGQDERFDNRQGQLSKGYEFDPTGVIDENDPDGQDRNPKEIIRPKKPTVYVASGPINTINDRGPSSIDASKQGQTPFDSDDKTLGNRDDRQARTFVYQQDGNIQRDNLNSSFDQQSNYDPFHRPNKTQSDQIYTQHKFNLFGQSKGVSNTKKQEDQIKFAKKKSLLPYKLLPLPTPKDPKLQGVVYEPKPVPNEEKHPQDYRNNIKIPIQQSQIYSSPKSKQPEITYPHYVIQEEPEATIKPFRGFSQTNLDIFKQNQKSNQYEDDRKSYQFPIDQKTKSQSKEDLYPKNLYPTQKTISFQSEVNTNDRRSKYLPDYDGNQKTNGLLQPSMYVVTPFPEVNLDQPKPLEPPTKSAFPTPKIPAQIKYGTRLFSRPDSGSGATQDYQDNRGQGHGQFQKKSDELNVHYEDEENYENDENYEDEESNESQESPTENTDEIQQEGPSEIQNTNHTTEGNLTYSSTTLSPKLEEKANLNIIDWKKYSHIDDSGW